MSEIICFFTFHDSNESNYFIVESNISFQQLQNFLLTSKFIDDSFTIETASNEPLTEETLAKLLAEAVSSDSPMHIVFKRKPIAPETIAPEIIQPVVEAKIEPIGPTMRSILEQIGVKIDESILSDAQSCLAALPFPYSFLFKQYFEKIMKNSNMQPIVKQVAEMFTVDEQALLTEVQVAVDFIKNPPAPNPIKQQVEQRELPNPIPQLNVEPVAECANHLLGPILTQILKEHFGVEESSLHSQEKILNTVKTLPFFRGLFRCAQKPRIIHFLANGLAHRFSVDNEKVTQELKQLAEILRSSQSHSSTENQIPPFSACRGLRKCHKARLGRVHTNVFHPATCDSCKALISGIRFYCLNCKNYDLCSACEQKNTDAPFHDESHIFAKIRDATTPYKIDHLICTPPRPHPCAVPSSSPSNGDALPHQHRAHSHLPPCFYSSPLNGQEGSRPGESEIPHWWFKRFQHRAESSNRLDQLEASVKQLKESLAKLQNL
jgi:hypothetical protein